MKPLAAGREIDAYCTKCRLDLGHRIVAMVQDKPKRVVCMTCGSEHAYRAPKSGAGRPAGGVRPTVGHKPRQKAALNSNEWEKRIAGQATNAFIRFSIQRSYRPGDLIIHSKFGEGYVLSVLEDGKVSIMFRDGPKTLAHGQS